MRAAVTLPAEQVAALARLPLPERRAVLEQIERRDGPDVARALKDAVFQLAAPRTEGDR